MRILVHLVYFAPGKIRPVTIPDNTFPENLLDTVFHYGQNDIQPLPFPSVSMGDIIENPFDGRLYRVEMMGFKALPTGSGPYSTNPSDWRANPLDTSGIICDFCGKPGITQIIFCRSFMLGNVPRAQFAGCDSCIDLINTRNTRQLITNACNMMPAAVRRAGRIHFADLYQTLISNIIMIRAVTPQDIFDLHIARTTAMHQKCQLRTGHPVIGGCNDLAYVEVETPGGWKKSCSTCATQQLGLKEIVEIVGHSQIRSLRLGRRNPRRRYSANQKTKVLRLCQETTLTFSEIGLLAGVSPTIVGRWCHGIGTLRKGRGRPSQAVLEQQAKKKARALRLCQETKLTYQEIGLKLRIDPAKIRGWCIEEKARLLGSIYKYSEEDREKILKLCSDRKLSYAEIAEQTGVNWQTVRNWCVEGGFRTLGVRYCQHCQQPISSGTTCENCKERKIQEERTFREGKRLSKQTEIDALLQPFTSWPSDEDLIRITSVPGAGKALSRKLGVSHQRVSQRAVRAKQKLNGPANRNPRLTKSGSRVLANRKLLSSWKPTDLRDNIIIVGPFGPTAEFFGHDKTTHLLYFLQDEADRPAVIDRIKNQDVAIFQPHVPRHLLWRGIGSISLFWKHSLARKYLAGALQYHFEIWPSGEVLVGTHMAVKPKWRRNKLNSLMIDFLHSEYPNHRILFHELTQDGKAFMKVYGGEEYQAAWNREPKV